MGCLKLTYYPELKTVSLKKELTTKISSETLRSSYLFGFNGQEKDDEISGAGNTNTALFWEYDTRLGRRWNLDPKPNPSISDYACLNNKPIWCVDILGDRPTPKEAAAISAHVYGDKRSGILYGGWKVSEKVFEGVKLIDSETGLKSQVYEREILIGKRKGEIEYVYATAGTEDKTDSKEDALQPLGKSKQYDLSVKNANLINQQLGKSKELTFSGHSLGGGEAAANAYATGRDAITFNAAGVSLISIVKYGYNFKSRVDAYILFTDPLNRFQNNTAALPDVNGTKHNLTPVDFPSLYNGHSMDNVLKCFGINPSLYQKHGGGGSW